MKKAHKEYFLKKYGIYEDESGSLVCDTIPYNWCIPKKQIVVPYDYQVLHFVLSVLEETSAVFKFGAIEFANQGLQTFLMYGNIKLSLNNPFEILQFCKDGIESSEGEQPIPVNEWSEYLDNDGGEPL